MKTYKTVEQEVNQIRLRIYEETKELASEQPYCEGTGDRRGRREKSGFQRVSSVKEKLLLHPKSGGGAFGG